MIAEQTWNLTTEPKRMRVVGMGCEFCAKPIRSSFLNRAPNALRLQTTAGEKHVHEVCFWIERARQYEVKFVTAHQLVCQLLASSGGHRRLTAEAMKGAAVAGFEFEVEELKDDVKILHLKGAALVDLADRMPPGRKPS